MGPPPTPDAAPAAAPRWPALDGLRGLAVAAVIAYHLGHLEGGYLGVDLFFVLSGFLITSLLLREGTATGAVDLRRFWVRRARRLLPALGVALVGVVVAARVWLDHSTLPALRVDALATAAYVANWRFATETAGGYFAADPSPLRHTWSLAIEEQYYVVWPLVVVAGIALARRWARRPAIVVGTVALAGAAASATWMALHATTWSTDRLYLGTDTRLVAPLSGALLACLLQGRLDQTPSLGARRAATVAGAAGLAGLAVAVVAVPPDSGWMYRGGFTLAALLGVASVAAGVVGRDGVVARALAPRPLRWVGERSYGLYLYSWPIQVVLAAQGLEGLALATGTVVGAVAVATVSFRYLEVPVRRDGLRALLPRRREPGALRTARGRAPLVLVAGAVLVVLGVVVAGTATTARPDPLAALGQDELEAGARRPAVAPTGAGSADGTSVLVVGDSVGYTLGEYAPPEIPGVASVDARALPGCGLLVEGTRPAEAVAAGAPDDYAGCATPVADADRLGLEGDPDVVLLVTGAWESSDHERDGRTVGPGDPGWTAEVRDLLDARVTDLSAQGAVVALWADPCGPDADERRRQAWFTDEVLSPVAEARPEAVLVRPAEVTCDGDRAVTDVPEVGDPRPDDGQHWSEEGAAWLWREWLGPELGDLASTDGEAEAPTPTTAPAPAAPTVPAAGDGPSASGPPPDALVVGDSVAFTLVHEVRRGARAAGIDVRGRAAIGCGVVREGTTPVGDRSLEETCGPVTEREDRAVRSEPDVVVAAWGAWEMAGVDGVPAAGGGRPGDTAYRTYVRERLAQRLTELGSTGSEVVVLGVDCWPPDEGRRPDAPGWWRDLSREVATEVGATYLDPTDLLCEDGAPRPDVADGADPRPGDGVHWSPAGAGWFWRAWLGPRLRDIVGR